MAELFDRWIKDRNSAVQSLNLEKFKRFILKYQKNGVYKQFPLPTDDVMEISMYKMATEITTMPVETRRKAQKWLLMHGLKPYIEWDNLTSRDGEYEVIEYTSEKNGYRGKIVHDLVLESYSLTAWRPMIAKPCLHTSSSAIRTLAELREFVDVLPELLGE